MDTALIIVDMLYDFIEGPLSCINSREAINETAAFINSMTSGAQRDEAEINGQFPIMFICDNHPARHCSFVENGGLWPSHCIQETHGSAIHDMLRPYATDEFTFYKGQDEKQEQYSGFLGMNKAGQTLADVLDIMDLKHICLCGISTECSVKALALDLKQAGYSVTILKDALGYASERGHLETLGNLKKEGIEIR